VAELTGGRLVAGHILPIYDGCLDEGIALIAGRARRPRSGGVPEHGTMSMAI